MRNGRGHFKPSRADQAKLDRAAIRVHERVLEVESQLRKLEEAHEAANPGVPFKAIYQRGFVFINFNPNAKRNLRLRVSQVAEVTAQLWAEVHARELDSPAEQP